MITHFRITDFKGHRDTRLALDRFTMLVGDNGSGKTSVLEALYLQSAMIPNPVQVLRGGFAPADMHRRGALDPIQWTSEWRRLRGSSETQITIAQESPEAWKVSVSGRDEAGPFEGTARLVNGGGSRESADGWTRADAVIPPAQFYWFDARQIAAGAYSDLPDQAVGADGSQTAVALAALKLGDDEAFDRIEAAMCKLVPSLERIRIRPVEVVRSSRNDTVIGSKLFFDFRGSRGVPAHHASQGTLVMLALLTVLEGRDRPNLVLLDEIEHALHPRAQLELIQLIREMLTLDDFSDTQIIATTHSPYMLDGLPPNEVIAFALCDDGTVASKPLSEHPEAEKTKGALKSGELWSLDAERKWVLG